MVYFSDSSDSQSDGTNSGCEEKSPKSTNNNTIKITNNGLKIIVEGAGSYNNSGKSLDADVVLGQDQVKRPPLMPRPPSALTTASIMKYRGKHLQN